MAKSKKQPDDCGEPLRMTPARLASEIHRIAEDASRLQLRLRGLAPFLGQGGNYEIEHDRLRLSAVMLADLAAAVRVGTVPIVAHRDEAADNGRYPLLDKPTPATAGACMIERDVEALLADAGGESDLPLTRDAHDSATEAHMVEFGYKPASGVSEAWRKILLTDLDMFAVVRDALDGAGITTVGALSDYLVAGRTLLEFDGVGPLSARDAIQALDEFWDEGVPPPWAGTPGTLISEAPRFAGVPEFEAPRVGATARRAPRRTFDVFLRGDVPDGGEVIGQMKAANIEEARAGVAEAFRAQEVDPARLEVRPVKTKAKAKSRPAKQREAS